MLLTREDRELLHVCPETSFPLRADGVVYLENRDANALTRTKAFVRKKPKKNGKEVGYVLGYPIVLLTKQEMKEKRKQHGALHKNGG